MSEPYYQVRVVYRGERGDYERDYAQDDSTDRDSHFALARKILNESTLASIRTVEVVCSTVTIEKSIDSEGARRVVTTRVELYTPVMSTVDG